MKVADRADIKFSAFFCLPKFSCYLDVIIILDGRGELLSPEGAGEAALDQLGDLLELRELGRRELDGRRALADLVKASVILGVLDKILGEVHTRVLALHVADLLPNLIAARPLLEAESQIEVVSLRPHDESLLLLLVGGV